MKTLYFYHDPNDIQSEVVRSNLVRSGLEYTELNLAKDRRIHVVSRGGPMLLIDLDGRTWHEFDLRADQVAILSTWNAVPSEWPPIADAPAPPLSMDEKRRLEIIAMDTSSLTPLNKAIVNGIQLLLKEKRS